MRQLAGLRGLLDDLDQLILHRRLHARVLVLVKAARIRERVDVALHECGCVRGVFEIDDEHARLKLRNLIVAPPWDAPIVVAIRPSMGFGTGHHATTRLWRSGQRSSCRA